MWWKLRPQIGNATLRTVLTLFLPLSVLVTIVEEMIWIVFFPKLPMGRPPMTYWHRLAFNLDAELMDNLVLFWSAFFRFRGIGYSKRYRAREIAATPVHSQLVQTQM